MNPQTAADRAAAPRIAAWAATTLATWTAAVLLVACGPEGPTASSASDSSVATGTPGTAMPKSTSQSAPLRADVASFDAGVVTSIQPITRTQSPSGAGAAVGGVLGAVIGHQVGGGDGRKVATAAAAVGGAVIGHNIEKDRARTVVGYRIDVHMDDGSTRTFQPQTVGGLAVGQRVRVDKGLLLRAG
jgi:outer membrane lipoprotein SlyB